MRRRPSEQLRLAYASWGEGELVLTGPDGNRSISYADIGRGPDVEAMLAEAMAVGRDGNAVDRVIADARTAIRGVTLSPRLTYDPDALAEAIVAFADTLALEPTDASVAIVDKTKFVVVPGSDGRLADAAVPVEAALADVAELDAPATLTYEVPVHAVPADITTVEAINAKKDAERIAARITIAVDEASQAITTTRIRSWLTFGPTPDGGYGVAVDTTQVPEILKKLAKKIDQAPVNASFKTSGGKITGVTASQTGYKMDVAATAKQVEALIAARIAGAATAQLEPTVKVTQPALTTAEAKAARPKMRKLSQWTTPFPIGEKNGFGANIWIPANLIDGYVVAPRATFDFWDAVGPVTRAKGYKSGGAIINGRTEPQGALAGGICSCSTTLFNAALRAGYEMGARRNHYYYIDRYPLGLDATVFISASGSKQTMSFTNDTDYPVLIRGYGYRNGGTGYVKFEVYSVPDGPDRQHRHRQAPEPAIRQGHRPVHVQPGARRGQAHRVPGQRLPGLGHAHRARPERQGHPSRHVLLELRDDHRDHARSASRLLRRAFDPLAAAAAEPGPDRRRPAHRGPRPAR